MTEKRYYHDGYAAEFTAVITGCRETEGRWLVTLDGTCFYPEGGGQPADTGMLGWSRVLDVQENDGEIFHTCDACPGQPGDTVRCHIDWERRFDFMQQHTGEHILSGILNRRYGFHNVGFHMGLTTVTVDFDGMIPQEDLPELELAVNEAIWRDLPIRTTVPSREELPNAIYRAKRALPWPVRIVTVPGYDSCACCGVHVSTTGQIGMVKLLSCVKFHQGVRLEMMCGRRAFLHAQAVYEENRKVSQAFSAKILETGEAAKRMNEALAAEKLRTGVFRQRLFDAMAREYAGRGNVLHLERELSNVEVRDLATAIAGTCGGMAAVFSGSGSQYSYCLAIREGDLRQVGRDMTARLHGRGGGKPIFQQGSVNATEEEIRSWFEAQA